jgi:hypothetical protein
LLLTHKPVVEETRYLKVIGFDKGRFGDTNEYRRKPVLPTPHFIAEKPEPWDAAPSPRSAALPGTSLKTGSIVQATIQEEKTKSGGVKLTIEPTGESAVLHPKSAPLPDTAAKLSFRVESTGTTPHLSYVDPAAPPPPTPPAKPPRRRGPMR